MAKKKQIKPMSRPLLVKQLRDAANELDTTPDVAVANLTFGEYMLEFRFAPEPGSPAWDKLAGAVARDYAPPMNTCNDCGLPVLSGLCCTFCGSVEP